MKLIEFHKQYPDEQSCRVAFKEMREKEGIVCKKCDNTTHYWKKNREEWECKKCRHQTRLRVGTVMESSKLPFYYWFVAMHLITSTKKSFSAKEVQRQLGHKRYEPIWAMLHKLRLVMGNRDAEYTLGNEVEFDEGFFETVSITRDMNEPLKRGRGSEKQTIVLVSAESKTVEDVNLSEKYDKKRKLGFVKMQVTESLKKKDITKYVESIIEKGSTLLTDGSNSFNDLHENFNHVPNVVAPKEASKALPWVHTAISNAKRLLLDIYHRIDDDFLQSYLNEFCFKLNRRYFDNIFDRLLIASVSYRWNYLG
jgi:ISXO2-like transposase domain/Transposase zinc-ribbon domain